MTRKNGLVAQAINMEFSNKREREREIEISKANI